MEAVINQAGEGALAADGTAIDNSVPPECCCGDGNTDPPCWIYVHKKCTPLCGVAGAVYYKIKCSTMFSATQTWREWLDWVRQHYPPDPAIYFKIGGECFRLAGGQETSTCDPSTFPEYTGFGGPIVDPLQECESCTDCCAKGFHQTCANGDQSVCHECGKSWSVAIRHTGTHSRTMTAAMRTEQLRIQPLQCFSDPDDFRFMNFNLSYQTVCVPSDLPGGTPHQEMRLVSCQNESRQETWTYYPECRTIRTGGVFDCGAGPPYLNAQNCTGVYGWPEFFFDGGQSGLFDFISATNNLFFDGTQCNGSHHYNDGSKDVTATFNSYHNANGDHFQVTLVILDFSPIGDFPNEHVIHAFTRTITMEMLVTRSRGPACEPEDGCPIVGNGGLNQGYGFIGGHGLHVNPFLPLLGPTVRWLGIDWIGEPMPKRIWWWFWGRKRPSCGCGCIKPLKSGWLSLLDRLRGPRPVLR